MTKNYAIIIQFVLSLTTFYRSGAQKSNVYKRDVFVTSWRFHNRAWQPQPFYAATSRLALHPWTKEWRQAAEPAYVTAACLKHPGHRESTEGLWPISDAHYHMENTPWAQHQPPLPPPPPLVKGGGGGNEMGDQWNRWCTGNWGTMRWGTTSCGTREMGDQWDGGPVRLGTNEMGDQWVPTMYWETNELGDQWEGDQ